MRLVRRKWSVLLALWLGQTAALIVVQVLMWGQSVHIGETALWAWPAVRDIEDMATSPEFWVLCGALAIVPPMLQGVFVLPLRLNAAPRRRGKALHLSLAVAALGVAALVASAIAGVAAVIASYAPAAIEDRHFFLVLLGAVGVSWAGCTALLIAYVRGSGRTNDAILTRVARLLFTGSVVEFLALIPLDVMVRRRTQCYCGEGTFFALIVVGSLGLIVAGPAMLLPLLAKRRAVLRRNMCEWCGYDLSGSRSAPVCPECGKPWGATAGA